ncbi:hypothetical protein EG329_002372 [Mollisiaceae sp. DMI_Dod_QoI]|nr:hypothetical protein EG329_002372 [Helotiales sp. DMI_Dod_QoI]
MASSVDLIRNENLPAFDRKIGVEESIHGDALRSYNLCGGGYGEDPGQEVPPASKETADAAMFAGYDFRTIAKEIVLRLGSIFDAAAKEQIEVEVLELMSAAAMDFVTAYLFGTENIENFLQNIEARRKWLKASHKTSRLEFWELEFPKLMKILTSVWLCREDLEVIEARKEVNDLCLQMLIKAGPSSGKDSDQVQTKQCSTPTKAVVYEQLYQHLYSSKEKYFRLLDSHPYTLASELMDHIKAGTETMGWTLTYIFHELSLRSDLQSRLKDELSSIHPFPATDIDQLLLRNIDVLPLLNAIILETLRLHTAVPGSQPRTSPLGSSVSLCGYEIPSGTTVSAQAYSLHRNAAAFPSPEEWKPERWLEADKDNREEMMRWFWAFGSGPRGCIGKEFAMLELKLLVAVVYRNFTTRVLDDEDIEQIDGYSTGPKSNRLVLRFERLE